MASNTWPAEVLAARLGVAMSDDECARVEAYEKTKHPLLRLLLRHRPERMYGVPGPKGKVYQSLDYNLRARTPSSTFGYRREDMAHRLFARETRAAILAKTPALSAREVSNQCKVM